MIVECMASNCINKQLFYGVLENIEDVNKYTFGHLAGLSHTPELTDIYLNSGNYQKCK